MSELTVRYDLGAAETDAAIRAKLIEMGWTPPGQGQPSAEPVAEPRKKDSVLFHLAEILRKVQGRTCDETGDELDVGYECMRIRDLCKAAPPAPDVSALVEALERINRMDSMSYYSLESAKIVARAALAAHRKGGEV